MQREELRLLGLSVILGAVMGTVFDILRAARYLLPSGTILTALGDILFFAAYTTAFGAFTASCTRGELHFCYLITEFFFHNDTDFFCKRKALADFIVRKFENILCVLFAYYE